MIKAYNLAFKICVMYIYISNVQMQNVHTLIKMI